MVCFHRIGDKELRFFFFFFKFFILKQFPTEKGCAHILPLPFTFLLEWSASLRADAMPGRPQPEVMLVWAPSSLDTAFISDLQKRNSLEHYWPGLGHRTFQCAFLQRFLGNLTHASYFCQNSTQVVPCSCRCDAPCQFGSSLVAFTSLT